MRALLLIALGVAVSQERHLRLETENGAVHVFQPRGYDPRTAGTVFYVHGYYDDVDEAWDEHQLQRQFEQSGRNALFIAVEAPKGETEEVRWKSQKSLHVALKSFGVDLPKGPKTAVAHSGGFRTVRAWLFENQLDHVVLLDGLYNAEEQFGAWASTKRAPASLVLVAGAGTRERTEKLVDGRDDVATVESHDAPRPDARIAVVRSNVGHMEMVTKVSVIPAVLQWLPLQPVEKPIATSRRAARRPSPEAAALQ